MNINKKDIQSIVLSLVNFETLEIPIECFRYININEVSEKHVEIEFFIVDNGIKYLMTSNYMVSPIKRLSISPDIHSLTINFKNGSSVTKEVIWYKNDFSKNKYQKSELSTYKEILISVKKCNHKMNLKNVLNLKSGTIVLDDDDNEYLVCISDTTPKFKYLKDTIITSKLLYSKFRIKEN